MNAKPDFGISLMSDSLFCLDPLITESITLVSVIEEMFFTSTPTLNGSSN